MDFKSIFMYLFRDGKLLGLKLSPRIVLEIVRNVRSFILCEMEMRIDNEMRHISNNFH
jgi:hypothetical protein